MRHSSGEKQARDSTRLLKVDAKTGVVMEKKGSPKTMIGEGSYHSGERVRALRQLLVIFLGVSLVVGVPLLAFGDDSINPFKSSSSKISPHEESGEHPDGGEATGSVNVAEPVTLTLSFVGDCTLGTDENFSYETGFNKYYEDNGADYFFKNVRSIFEKDDLTVVNMEGTLTESTSREDKEFAFKGPPEYVSILAGSSVEAANVANNHSYDYGEQSYNDTVEILEKNDIETFGYERTKIVEVKGIKVGLSGITTVGKSSAGDEVRANMAALKEAGADLIIATFHWGEEGSNEVIDWQRELACIAIDEGADLVVGHHPHVLQGIEKYHGTYIAYSLGNFSFGGNSDPVDKDTMIFQQTFTITAEGAELNDDITVIPCSISSTTSHNDYCPTPLEGDEASRVLSKIESFSEDIKLT